MSVNREVGKSGVAWKIKVRLSPLHQEVKMEERTPALFREAVT